MLADRLAVLLVACALAACTSAPKVADCDLAIEHVNVIPMDSERLLTDRTVLIRGGRIAAVASGDGASCRTRIDGVGRYLLPGLNDMHVHVEDSAFIAAFHLPAQPIDFEQVLYPYLANGVTGIRIMSGSPDLLTFRASHHGPAPRMLIATPMLSGTPPVLPEPVTRVLTTPEAARAAIDEYAQAGYDFVKIRGNITRPVLEAIFTEADARHLVVDGHIPNIPDWTNQDVFSGRQRGIAHLDEISLRMNDDVHDPEMFAEGLATCHCFVTSTMVVDQNIPAQLRDFDAVASRSAMRFVSPLLRHAFWDREHNPYLAERPDPAFFQHLLARDMALVRALHTHNVTLMAGTDALNPMIIPGASMPDELALLVEAGLSPYDALRTATRTPAETFAKFSDLGVIAPGRTANLILLRANPLTDINAVRNPDAVIVDGVYISRADLDQRMEAIARRYAGQ